MEHIPGLYHLTEVRQRFGFLAGLQSLAYGVTRRLLRLHIYHLVTIETTNVTAIDDDEITYRVLTPDEIMHFACDAANALDEHFHRRLDSGQDLCFAAISDGKLLNYCWYAMNSIEGEHTWGSPVSFPASCAYFYKAFTHPNFRGRGINHKAIVKALGELSRRGINHVFGLVEINNWSSLRSCYRTGFRSIGRLVAMGCTPSRLMWVPQQARSMGIRFGNEARLNRRLH